MAYGVKLDPTPISGDLSDHEPTEDHGAEPIQGTITAIGISPLDSDIVWAGTDDGNVWVSDDAGSSWTQVDPPGPSYWVTGFAPDPFDADAVWLTHTGYRLNDTLPYMRHSGDLGRSWQDLDAGLPQIPLNDVVADQWPHGITVDCVGILHIGIESVQHVGRILDPRQVGRRLIEEQEIAIEHRHAIRFQERQEIEDLGSQQIRSPELETAGEIPQSLLGHGIGIGPSYDPGVREVARKMAQCRRIQ